MCVIYFKQGAKLIYFYNNSKQFYKNLQNVTNKYAKCYIFFAKPIISPYASSLLLTFATLYSPTLSASKSNFLSASLCTPFASDPNVSAPTLSRLFYCSIFRAPKQ